MLRPPVLPLPALSPLLPVAAPRPPPLPACGERSPRAAWRVRGTFHARSLPRVPSPRPSPRKRGEGVHRGCGGSAGPTPARALPCQGPPQPISEPPDPAAIAQLVEHIIRNDGVGGSNPSCGTRKINELRVSPFIDGRLGTTRAPHLVTSDRFRDCDCRQRTHRVIRSISASLAGSSLGSSTAWRARLMFWGDYPAARANSNCSRTARPR
jgi:hypothetical protein